MQAVAAHSGRRVFGEEVVQSLQREGYARVEQRDATIAALRKEVRDENFFERESKNLCLSASFCHFFFACPCHRFHLPL